MMWARSARPRFTPVRLPEAQVAEVRDVAVIDVGSNSVRLVLYRLEGRTIWPVFNEKVLAGLGREMAHTGRLSVDGREAAIHALQRFHEVLRARPGIEVFATGTAAVREAADRDEFLHAVKAQTGFELRVLSGAEEARYAALGVIAGNPTAQGVVGDLGGSSLELVRVAAGAPGAGVTLPLGPFALGAPGPADPAALAERCRAVLAPVADRFRSTTFHAVGGAWRNLAIMRMKQRKYPIEIVQQYELNRTDAIDWATVIAAQSKHSLDKYDGVSRRRGDTLPYAAVVLKTLVESLGVERVVLSAYGLREGLLFESMPATLRALDPLVEGCSALGARHGLDRLGAGLEDWLAPLWSKLDPLFEPRREEILLRAACRLDDLGARRHPDHRGELVFDEVLRSTVPGQTHAERTFIATALFHRYAGDRSPAAAVRKLLSPEQRDRARALGLAIRLGCDLSGGAPALLRASSLAKTRGDLVLTIHKDAPHLTRGEQTNKRAEALAEALGLKLKVRTR